MRNLYYLFDAPGEQFAAQSRFGKKQVIQHLKGIVLLVDPFSTRELSAFSERIPGETKVSEIPLWDIVSVMIAGVNQMLLRRQSDQCEIPLAVVISKADAFPVEEFPFLKDLASGERNPHTPELSGRCRQALEKLGEGRTVRALEQKFSNIQYFSCSALGRSPDFRNTTPFHPNGVLEPFFWILDLKEPAAGKQPRRVMVPEGAQTGD
jgi:hypothetical protein